MLPPYKSLRIVEFGRFIAAPYCGQLFADGGADVIKIEPVIGDDSRRNGTRLSATEARQYINKNRGKRCVAVDLSDAMIRESIARLVDTADVVLANFRPGQAEKLGLAYEQVRVRNSNVIYAENTAFGPTGPMAAKAGMDVLLQAYAGVASLKESGPEMNIDPIVDYTAALLMAWGVATALYAREKTGTGQRLDVSLLQAALVIQNNSVNHIDTVDGWREEFVDYLKEAFSRGHSFADVLAQRETLKPTIAPPYYGFFRTQDGFLALAAGGLALRRKVARLLGIEDPSLKDAGFQPQDVAAHTAMIRSDVQACLSNETTAHWLLAFEEVGVPAGVVNMKEQILNDAQCWENDYLVRLEHEELGGMTVVGPPVKFSKTPLSVQGPTPTLGRHTREVLLATGMQGATIDTLAKKGLLIA